MLDAADTPYSGRFLDGTHHFAVRVYYEDTDAGGVVYHANYLRFFERARSDMLRIVGADHVTEAAERRGFYVVSHAHLLFRKPARLGDALVIRSWMEDIRRTSCVIQQRVMREDAVLTEGRVVVAYVTPEGRPQRQPQAWIEAFRAVMGAGTAE